MCVFVSRPINIGTFLWKNGDHPKRVVDFLLERDTFQSKIMEIVEDLASEVKFFHFRCSSFSFIFHFLFFHFSICSFFIFSFFHFSFFLLFFHFSIVPFFHFSIVSGFHLFHFFHSHFFIFFHFLHSFFILLHSSSCFFMFFSFFFIFFNHFSSLFFPFFSSFLGCSKSNFFLASIAARFLVRFVLENHFFEPSRRVPLWVFFSLFFLVFFFKKIYLFKKIKLFLSLFSFFSRKKFLLFFFLVFLSNIFFCWH